MMQRVLFAAATAAVLSTAVALPAHAKCTRLGFSVNDYGKDGPTKDAQALLDKYIASWAAERGIKGYRTSKKSVNCELFLNFIVFDEHTCRAEADVCWGEPGTGGNPSKSATSVKTPDSDLTTGTIAKPAAKPAQ